MSKKRVYAPKWPPSWSEEAADWVWVNEPIKDEIVTEFINEARKEQQKQAARARQLALEKTSQKYRRILGR